MSKYPANPFGAIQAIVEVLGSTFALAPYDPNWKGLIDAIQDIPAGGGGGGSGTVTSVGLTLPAGVFGVTGSPVTTAGTITVSLNTQTSNTVFAAPSAGDGVPTFRSLVANDIPSLPYSQITGLGSAATADYTSAVFNANQLQGRDINSAPPSNDQVLGWNSATSRWEPKTPNAGTVTSVGLSLPNVFSISGTPVTSSGVFTVGLSSQSINQVWASPASGGGGTPAFRALVEADLPTISDSKLSFSSQLQNLVLASPNGSSGTPTWRALVANDLPTIPDSKLSYGSQTQNRVLASPNGSSGSPTFRALVAADIPTISNTQVSGLGTAATANTSSAVFNASQLQGKNVATTAPTNGQALIYNTSSTQWEPQTLSGTGTVSSVGLSLPAIFSVSGSPVTSSGTLTATLASQTQNLIWASPNGSSGSPTFRTLVDADIPDALTISGGTVNNSPIGQSTAAAIKGTEIQATTRLIAEFPTQVIEGLTLSRNGGTANYLDIAAGRTYVDLGSGVRVAANLSSGWTKRLNTAWATGNNAGLLATGSIAANTWYHIFVIVNTSTYVVDLVADTSVSGANIPAGYAGKCIGSVLTDGSSNIRAFGQTRNYFFWYDFSLDVLTSALTSTATLYSLAVPPGLSVLANVQVYLTGSTTNYMYFSSPLATDEAPLFSSGLITIQDSAIDERAQILIPTNTSRQVRGRATATYGTGVLRMNTVGWFDPRLV